MRGSKTDIHEGQSLQASEAGPGSVGYLNSRLCLNATTIVALRACAGSELTHSLNELTNQWSKSHAEV
jgi:hypothetical protein